MKKKGYLKENEFWTDCDWCGENFPISELKRTDLGLLCDICIRAVQSRGEEVIIFGDVSENDLEIEE